MSKPNFTQRKGGMMADVRITISVSEQEIADLKELAHAIYGKKSMWRQVIIQATHDGLVRLYESAEAEDGE